MVAFGRSARGGGHPSLPDAAGPAGPSATELRPAGRELSLREPVRGAKLPRIMLYGASILGFVDSSIPTVALGSVSVDGRAARAHSCRRGRPAGSA